MINSPTDPVEAVRPNLPAPSPGAPLARTSADVMPVAGAFHVREVVDQTITPNDFPRLTSLVRALAPHAGTARQFGDGLQWEHDSDFSSLSLTINPEAGGTVIRADLRTDKGRVVYVLGSAGATLLAGIGATVAHLPLAGVLGTAAATLVASGWCARLLSRRVTRRQAAALHQLVAKIATGLRGEVD